MKRKSDEMSPLGQKDTYRRSEMEFGVAADAYRSDPAKKATRNGAVMVTVAFSIAAFAMVLAASVADLRRAYARGYSCFRGRCPRDAFFCPCMYGLGARCGYAFGKIQPSRGAGAVFHNSAA